MRYYQIYAWTDCPFCENAKQLLIEKNEQFMFCCLDQSDALLVFLKSKYEWETVPMILEKHTDSNDEKLIGGYTDLVEYFNEEQKQSPV